MRQVGVVIVLFNESFRTGIVPRDWSDALVTKVFEKGAAMSKEPVSLTCILCKVLEKIEAKLLDHFMRYKIVEDSQHALVIGTSLLNKYARCFRGDLSFMTNIFDFVKAFEKVPLSRLATKVFKVRFPVLRSIMYL